jgi:hypothetical protein
MSEKRILIYSEGDFNLDGESNAEQFREVFKEYEQIKGDPFSEAYEGKRVTQTLKVISENFYTFMVNKVRADEGISGVLKRQLKEETCDIIVFDNVEFEEIVVKYEESIKEAQKELVRDLNSLTEEREFIKTSFRKAEKQVDLSGE